MSFAWFVARRYLVARRRQAFISLISAVSILGVTVGVMALVIALALMTGMQTELRDRIVGSTAHVYVLKRSGAFANTESERLRWIKPGVAGASPAIVGLALLNTGGNDGKPATLKGIDIRHEASVTDLTNAMESGSLEGLANRKPEDFDGIVLGSELARELGVAVGDEIDAVTMAPTATIVGLMPHRRVFKVIGTFKFGFFEVDSTYALMSLESAADMLNREGPDMMQLRLARMDDAPAVRRRLQDELGLDYSVQDWTELNGPLYSALWLEKIAISLTIGLIVMVAALNIVASLVLMVMEKSRDIAILRTIGASATVVRRIFVYQGLAIGAIGTGLGTTLGLAVCYVAERYQLVKLPADVYLITYVPFRVQWLDVVIVVAAAMAICLGATIYPSRQAGRIDPAEALRSQ